MKIVHYGTLRSFEARGELHFNKEDGQILYDMSSNEREIQLRNMAARKNVNNYTQFIDIKSYDDKWTKIKFVACVPGFESLNGIQTINSDESKILLNLSHKSRIKFIKALIADNNPNIITPHIRVFDDSSYRKKCREYSFIIEIRIPPDYIHKK